MSTRKLHYIGCKVQLRALADALMRSSSHQLEAALFRGAIPIGGSIGVYDGETLEVTTFRFEWPGCYFGLTHLVRQLRWSDTAEQVLEARAQAAEALRLGLEAVRYERGEVEFADHPRVLYRWHVLLVSDDNYYAHARPGSGVQVVGDIVHNPRDLYAIAA